VNGISASPEAAKEEVVLQNIFGTVTNKSLIFGGKNEASRVDIGLQHVTAVRIVFERHLFWGTLLAAIPLYVGYATLSANWKSILAVLLIIPLLAMLGFFLVWGAPVVVVTLTSGMTHVVKGSAWERKQAYEFMTALRARLFQ